MGPKATQSIQLQDLTKALLEYGISREHRDGIMRACERVRLERLLDANTTAQLVLMQTLEQPRVNSPEQLRAWSKQAKKLSQLSRRHERLCRQLYPKAEQAPAPDPDTPTLRDLLPPTPFPRG